MTSSQRDPDEILAVFMAAADAQMAAVAQIRGPARRARTDRPGQYALDLVADEAVLAVLAPTGCAIVSEESGYCGPPHSPITIVVDPVDGSTNCSRNIPYWSISLCALDSEGPLVALVVNCANGERFSAIRGQGAYLQTPDQREIITPALTKRVADSVVAVSGLPSHDFGWKQFRALGSAALTLCDVAAGRVDAYYDVLTSGHAPWDYLGGLLMCTEAGAVVVDYENRGLVTTDIEARRTLRAAATADLLADLTRSSVGD